MSCCKIYCISVRLSDPLTCCKMYVFVYVCIYTSIPNMRKYWKVLAGTHFQENYQVYSNMKQFKIRSTILLYYCFWLQLLEGDDTQVLNLTHSNNHSVAIPCVTGEEFEMKYCNCQPLFKYIDYSPEWWEKLVNYQSFVENMRLYMNRLIVYHASKTQVYEFLYHHKLSILPLLILFHQFLNKSYDVQKQE